MRLTVIGENSQLGIKHFERRCGRAFQADSMRRICVRLTKVNSNEPLRRESFAETSYGR